MKVWRKFTAVALALVMMLAMSAVASADTSLSSATNDDTLGQAGTFATEDAATSLDKILVLNKELTAYNPSEDTIKAPTITYTYSIAPATEADVTNKFVQDKADKHNPQGSVTVPVKAGVTGTLTVTGESGNNTITWVSTEDITAAPDGHANIKTVKFDFSTINFGAPGVYRYVVTENFGTNFDWNSSGITGTKVIATDNSETNGSRSRYVDVYVRAHPTTFTGSGGASDWDIYGYTCFYGYADGTVNTLTDTNKKDFGKTTGFVAGTIGTGNDAKTLTADSYYTYNLEVSKTVDNDNYAKSHDFPFTILLTNSAITQNVGIRTETAKVDANGQDASATGFGITSNPIAGTFTSANAFEGVLNIKHNTKVKYVGIPCGTAYEVYETNDMDGTTYNVTTTHNNTPNSGETVTSTNTTPTTAVTQVSPKPDYQSTKQTDTPAVDTNATTECTVGILNKLVNISPTGVTLRYAPYLAMLGAGIVALPLSIRRKKEDF